MNIYSVSQINSYINNLISSDTILKKIMIRGEISNFKLHYSGHCYLTLKDDNAAIRAVIFRRHAQKLSFKPENGMSVIACGSVNVYERDGAYQLYIEQLIPDGAGALSTRYEQLKKQLEEEGLFAPEHRKTLPQHARSIGIITSRTGAVLHDIFTVSSRRDPSVKLLLYPVLVQGEGSARQLIAALHYFNKHKDLCDVIIIGRGGGSMEDLWSFNEESVVRAVYASQIPVVSAVGHETDYTLTDFVSDRRAATPSEAAELCVPSRAEWLQRLASVQAHLTEIAHREVDTARERLDRCSQSIVFKDAYELLADKYQQIDILTADLSKWVHDALADKRNKLTLLSEKTALLDPQAALQRGYTMLYKNDKVAACAADLNKDDKVKIVLADGHASAVIEDIVKDM